MFPFLDPMLHAKVGDWLLFKRVGGLEGTHGMQIYHFLY